MIRYRETHDDNKKDDAERPREIIRLVVTIIDQRLTRERVYQKNIMVIIKKMSNNEKMIIIRKLKKDS